ncbi:MAG: hypothetical protein JWN44_657 [Myxococcales bacterium]|nr:hypothetical protein [Myxococcales bacterium]
MYAVVAESDSRLAAAVADELRQRRVRVLVAHDFTTATRLLAEGPRPAVLYVGEGLRPLTGADLLADVERCAHLAGVPKVAVVPSEDCLLAIVLRRGGVHIVVGAPSPGALAALLAKLAACATAAGCVQPAGAEPSDGGGALGANRQLPRVRIRLLWLERSRLFGRCRRLRPLVA